MMVAIWEGIGGWGKRLKGTKKYRLQLVNEFYISATMLSTEKANAYDMHHFS